MDVRPVLIKYLLVTLSLAAALGGCASTPTDENDPGALFKEAEAEIKSDRYLVAIEKLRIIKNRFPYSKYSLEAELRVADVYFLQESWTEAALAYELFTDLHPKHERVGYALFRAGKSHLNDVPSTIARDLTPARKAIAGYEVFISRATPADAELVAEARADSAQLRSLLAEKEGYIGDFYARWDGPLAARRRYEKLIRDYPDTPAAKAAAHRLATLPPAPEEKP